MRTLKNSLLLALALAPFATAAEPPKFDYRLLATQRTSTMEKEMNEAGAGGYVFGGVMGGETGFGGKEVVVVMMKRLSGALASRKYKLLATSRTSTLQKEMQQAGEEGFEYRGQTVFESAFGGKEVSVIMERDTAGSKRFSYRLLATSRTSTMQKELQEAGGPGFLLLGVSVGKTSLAGAEVVCIMGRDE